MSLDPQYSNAVALGVGVLSAADTSRTAPTNVATVVTAGANGTRMETVEVVAAGAVTAGMVRLFLYDGSNYRLIREIPVTAVTPSATAPVWSAILVFGDLVPLLLKNGWSLRATTHNAEAFNVIGYGGDF